LSPRRCCQCAEYSLRISDLENRLTLAKRQAQMAFDKASKASGLMKQISILDDKVSSLMAKIMHHEECDSFVISLSSLPARCCDVRFLVTPLFPPFVPLLLCDIICHLRHLFGFCC
jgi:hypothetical protein